MSATKDGGPAFPQGERYRTTDLGGNVTEHSKAALLPGMTLRDYFAAKALQGIIAHPAEELYEADGYTQCATMKDTQRRAAEMSYGYADAMLKARES